MYYSLITLLLLAGTYILLNTYRRFEKRNNKLTFWAMQHKTLARILSALCMLGFFIILLPVHGFWTTLFMELNALILLFMLVILLNPIKQIKSKHVYYISFCMIIIEILLTYAR